MLDLQGEAVLALWNGVEPARKDDYNAWHSREHVPERLGIAGILGARRYVRLAGPLPEYLTLYDLASIDVLSAAPYRALLDNPTSWSRAMRPFLRDFMRVPCRRAVSIGGGLGSVIAACSLARVELGSIMAEPKLDELTRLPGIVAVHLLSRDAAVADVPFQVGGEPPQFARDGILLFESYDEAGLGNGVLAVHALLRRLRAVDAAETLTTYRLALAIDRASAARMTPIAQPTH